MGVYDLPWIISFSLDLKPIHNLGGNYTIGSSFLFYQITIPPICFPDEESGKTGRNLYSLCWGIKLNARNRGA